MALFVSFVVALLARGCSGTNAAGKQFLQENAKRPGIHILPSGLQYKVIQVGKGEKHPQNKATVEFHYAGTTLDIEPRALELDVEQWDTFDSSWKRKKPMVTVVEAALNNAMREMLLVMVEGDWIEMYVPSKMGYGDQDVGRIKAGSVLIYQIKLIRASGDMVPVLKCNTKTLDDCTKKEQAYITVMMRKTEKERKKEVKRLEKMVHYGSKEEHMVPTETRIRLLKNMDTQFGRVREEL